MQSRRGQHYEQGDPAAWMDPFRVVLGSCGSPMTNWLQTDGYVTDREHVSPPTNSCCSCCKRLRGRHLKACESESTLDERVASGS